MASSSKAGHTTINKTVTIKEFLTENAVEVENAEQEEERRIRNIRSDVRASSAARDPVKSCVLFSQEVSHFVPVLNERERLEKLCDLTGVDKKESETDIYEESPEQLEYRLTTKDALVDYATKQPEHKYKSLPESITRELTSEEIDDLLLVFKTFDRKNRGAIDKSDLQLALKSLGFKLSKKTRKDMLDLLAKNRKGRVDFQDFLEFVVKYQQDGPDPYEDLMRVYSTLDPEGKGYMTEDDIRGVVETFGINLSRRMISEMIDEADENGDRKISKKEFMKVMLQTNKFQVWAFGKK